jgi:O-Antigen ligase
MARSAKSSTTSVLQGPKGLWDVRYFLLLSALVFVTAFPKYGYPAALLLIVPLVLHSVDGTIIGIVALMFVRSLSTGISQEITTNVAYSWIALIFFFLRLLISIPGKSGFASDRVFQSLFIFIVAALISSRFASPAFFVSFLKISMFGLVALVIVRSANSSSLILVSLRRGVFCLWCTCLILSLVTIELPSISYARDGVGFQGILNHPQALGLVMAPFAAYLIAGIFESRRLRAGHIALMFVVLAAVFMTKARTGVFALVLGLSLVWLLRTNITDKATARWLGRRSNAISFAAPLVATVAIIGLVSVALLMPELLFGFIFKSSDTMRVGEAFDQSRGFLIEQAWNNFLANPLFGIGFGIAASDTHLFEVNNESWMPTSAPTEKANLIAAVVEETGLFGIVFFLPALYFLLKRISRSGNVGFAAAAVTAVSTNLSEMTIFSTGGYGLYIWLVIACASGKTKEESSRLATHSVGRFG